MAAAGNPANDLVALINGKRAASKLPALRNSRGLGCMAGRRRSRAGDLRRVVAKRSSGEDEHRTTAAGEDEQAELACLLYSTASRTGR